MNCQRPWWDNVQSADVSLRKVEAMKPATCACQYLLRHTRSRDESMGRGTRSGREAVLRGMSHPTFPASLPTAWLLQHTQYVGEEAGSTLPCLYQLRTRSVASTPYQVCQHAPRFFSRVKLQSVLRGLRDLFQSGATQLSFFTSNSTYVLTENQEVFRDILPKAIGIFSRGQV